ncbi:MAG: M23 family metallopeptidase [Acidipila sp.]|nr:M23 family metallopeptidase [Acidipila sp.]
MMSKSFTFIVVSSDRGQLRRVKVPFYALYFLALFALVGGVTVLAATGSYTRMLWKATSYNALRRDQEDLKRQYMHLQVMAKDSDQKLSSLQSLATDVAMTYGILRLPQTPFFVTNASTEQGASYLESVEQFNFLKRNATSVALSAQGLRFMPGRNWEDMSYTPSFWPVLGTMTGSFGERLDPFSGEGAFHTGVDISAPYGAEVRATADGIVESTDTRSGYGRLVVVDHGFGVTTWYGHLSGFKSSPGEHVKRGEVIGRVGVSGRSSGPHVHYEVRMYGAPVNPARYLRGSSSGD